ncbi:hypothetical protein AURDEDRAFT_175825 [Auricularia subglabra TFB-10046 SS5]|uniref:Uncharacterized protein n=1 Tax=Auricularia subglabra (strain TFB-10046 / SS5) TaxID=717982 RepID=J0LE50_AURST|nr:hypothetical protein AURDEDRAFT_175825 [Auricularia subglabra TFB-10046 SS5]
MAAWPASVIPLSAVHRPLASTMGCMIYAPALRPDGCQRGRSLQLAYRARTRPATARRVTRDRAESATPRQRSPFASLLVGAAAHHLAIRQPASRALPGSTVRALDACPGPGRPAAPVQLYTPRTPSWRSPEHRTLRNELEARGRLLGRSSVHVIRAAVPFSPVPDATRPRLQRAKRPGVQPRLAMWPHPAHQLFCCTTARLRASGGRRPSAPSRFDSGRAGSSISEACRQHRQHPPYDGAEDAALL